MPGSPLEQLGKTAFFSVHLDAQSEEKRVDQLRKCLERARALGTRQVVFAGDLNTECRPGSCIRAFVSDEAPSDEDMARECASALRIAGTEDGDDESPANQKELKGDGGDGEPSADQLAAWHLLWQKAAKSPSEHRVRLTRVPTGPTRSAYDHGKTEGPCVSWRLAPGSDLVITFLFLHALVLAIVKCETVFSGMNCCCLLPIWSEDCGVLCLQDGLWIYKQEVLEPCIGPCLDGF